MSAVRRWMNWQIGSRLVPGPVVVNFVNDSKLVVEPGMTGATGNIYAGLHEFSDMAFALHLLRAGDLFVDVGANVGTYTVLAATIGAKSIAIEPIEKAFFHLKLNLRVNAFDGFVDARQIGVASTGGTRRFTNQLDTVNHLLREGEICSDSCEVVVETLDDVVGNENPTLIKIDVEGAEREVLAGAERVLSNQSLLALIVELNGNTTWQHRTDKSAAAHIQSYGFLPVVYDPYRRTLTRINPQNQKSANTIFVRDFREVSERLEAAAKFSVLGIAF